MVEVETAARQVWGTGIRLWIRDRRIFSRSWQAASTAVTDCRLPAFGERLFPMVAVQASIENPVEMPSSPAKSEERSSAGILPAGAAGTGWGGEV